MADDYAKPIATLITEDIVEALSRVRVEQGYSVSLIVERLNADNHEFNNPRHLLAIVDPGDPVKGEEEGSTDDDYERTYIIHVWVMPSQLDGKPIDETWDAIIADIVKALCYDDGGATIPTAKRNGLATDTIAGDPETAGPFLKTLAYLINVPIKVIYSTRTRNPYNPNRG
jgi:hypothetical protein